MPVSTSSDVSIKQWKNKDPLKIDQFTGIEPFHIKEATGIEPLRISEIAPAAVHIKELNHIDPITLEPLRVNEVKNIDPISVEKFNVTHLPTVNLSVRQLPALDMNVKRIPPCSVGFHQDIHIPSNYTVRARLLGFEIFRLNMNGHTMLVPKDKARREQSKTHEKSFPEVASIGNPAIPSKHSEKTTVLVSRPHPHSAPANHEHHPATYHGTSHHHQEFKGKMNEHRTDECLNFRLPQTSFSLRASPQSSDSSISSGGM